MMLVYCGLLERSVSRHVILTVGVPVRGKSSGKIVSYIFIHRFMKYGAFVPDISMIIIKSLISHSKGRTVEVLEQNTEK